VYSSPRREKTRRWETSFRSLFTGQSSYLSELSGPQTLDGCRAETQNRLRTNQVLSLVWNTHDNPTTESTSRSFPLYYFLKKHIIVVYFESIKWLLQRRPIYHGWRWTHLWNPHSHYLEHDNNGTLHYPAPVVHISDYVDFNCVSESDLPLDSVLDLVFFDTWL
jgi:hypothetical protein